MTLQTYRLHRIYSEQLRGTTLPSRCSISAILKFDHPTESPHCVYNEYVALRIAQKLNIPVAEGCLSVTGDGQVFASLELGSPGMSLPDVTPSRYRLLMERYPDEMAALLVFDLLIGNRDRGQSIKAALVTPQIRFFAGYDHSHSLLNIEQDPWQSIQRLHEEEWIVEYHPFIPGVDIPYLERWIERVCTYPQQYIAECCLLGRPFRGVSEEMQQALADALVRRMSNIWDLYERDQFYLTRLII